MISNFIGRNKELKILNEFYLNNKFENIVIYGRRRVGKTFLCNKFLENKNGMYFLATKDTIVFQAQRLMNKFCELYNIFPKEVKTFEEVFLFIVDFLNGERFVLVLDEFPYLIEEDKSIPSKFQLIIDEILNSSNVFLIFSGSSISIMENEVLSYKSPLYGRRTGQLEVLPFEIMELVDFFPNKKFEEILEYFFVLDSIPAYLEKFDSSKDVFENIKDKILSKGQFLNEEVNFLLNQELREPKNYKRILLAIANGKNRLSEISNEVGISVNVLSNYLDTLINLHILKRVSPVLSKKSLRKNSIYKFEDNFFKFYFKFVFPNLELLEEGKIDVVLNEIKDNFSIYASFIFEDVCIKFVRKLGIFKNVGSFWDKNVEIDILSYSNNEKVFLGEVKWIDKVDERRILNKLDQKTEFVKGFEKYSYGVFAKSFRKRNGIVFDLKDIERVLVNNDVDNYVKLIN